MKFELKFMTQVMLKISGNDQQPLKLHCCFMCYQTLVLSESDLITLKYVSSTTRNAEFS